MIKIFIECDLCGCSATLEYSGDLVVAKRIYAEKNPDTAEGLCICEECLELYKLMVLKLKHSKFADYKEPSIDAITRALDVFRIKRDAIIEARDSQHDSIGG